MTDGEDGATLSGLASSAPSTCTFEASWGMGRVADRMAVEEAGDPHCVLIASFWRHWISKMGASK